MSSDLKDPPAVAAQAGAPVAVRAEGLGKLYRVGATQGAYRYRLLSEQLASRLRSRGGETTSESRTFWALRNVAFEIAQGEVVGIIGRNGAGKSTLLKVISRITAPTEGRVQVRGVVGSLLEVGTGFHPELTGRENIFLSGAVLGMRRADIVRQLDAIIDFAGVAKFVDTPIKRYSTGMYLRLAFAVAAHLDTDVLLVDEVLAVGDAEFQKKCLGRMAEIGSTGRTVLFVSHSMPSLLRLCPRLILLDRGGVVADGPAHQVARRYLESGMASSGERVWDSAAVAPGDSVARLKSVRVRRADGSVGDEVDIRQPVQVELEFWNLSGDHDAELYPSLQFFNDEGTCLFVSNRFGVKGLGVVRATCTIPGNYLAEGQVLVTAAVGSLSPTAVHALEREAVSFQVIDRSAGDGVRGTYVGDWPGVVRPKLAWAVEVEPPAAGAAP